MDRKDEKEPHRAEKDAKKDVMQLEVNKRIWGGGADRGKWKHPPMYYS